MVKKWALAFSVLLFIGSFFFFAYEPKVEELPEVLSEGALAGEVRQGQKLWKSLAETLDGTTIRLCFKGELLASDEASLTWYLPVDMDLDGWEAGAFTDEEKEIGIYPLEDYTLREKAQTVADGYAVPFLACKEKEGTCAVIRVVFTGLPVVRMETDADLDIDTVFAGSTVFYEACGQTDWTVKSAFQAHERGQTTRTYPKKGYRVNLIRVSQNGVVSEQGESVFGMGASDSWIFYAIYSDGTKIRDRLNTELWKEMGACDTPYEVSYGTDMRYAELIVNGEYRGLYGIFKPINSSQLALTDQDVLYKRTYGRELLSELFDEAEPEEYLTVLGMEIKGRKGAGTKADWSCFRDFVKMCELPDAEFKEEAEILLNMDNMTDIWLYLQLLYGEDNIYKNMFFAFKKEAGGHRLYLIPWDTDLTWGNGYVNEKESLYVEWMPEHAEGILEWPFADRLFRLNVGGIREKAAERWKELRESTFSEEHLETLMEAYRHKVEDSGAFARDALRWPESRHDGDCEGMTEFMETRLQYLDEKFADMENWIQE